MLINSMDKLLQLIQEMENKIPQSQVCNTTVSKASVGWHIEHSLLTIHAIIKALKNSNPNNYQKTFNLKRMLVYAFNKFPRGKAKAPDVVLPKNEITADIIKTHLEKIRAKINGLHDLNPNSFFAHHVFGQLNLKQTKKLFLIHTQHHLHIINDMIDAKA